MVEEVNRLNGITAREHSDPGALTRIAQYEMAFKMQASVPELTDFNGESPRYHDDLHATLLHLCVIDHAKFSVKFQGLDAKLTGVEVREPCKHKRRTG